MIKSWRHKGLKSFYETGSKAGIQAKHSKRLTIILQLLSHAKTPKDMDLWNMRLHLLKGDLKGFYSVKVSGNWRVIFKFHVQNVELVDYIDYH